MDFTPEEARQFTDEIQSDIVNLWQKTRIAYERNAWSALGYRTWHNYCDEELAGIRPVLERAERKELVGEFKELGMSKREVASTLGVSEYTVRQDLKSNDSYQSGAIKIAPDHLGSAPATDSDIEPYQIVDSTAYVNTKTEIIVEPQIPKDTWSKEERGLQSLVLDGVTVVASLRSGLHKNLLGWAEAKGFYVRIDRKTQWGNPFELPADGDRDTVIGNYENHYLPYKPSLLAKISDLKGKVLVCWCAPEFCHGDVLKRWAEK